MEQPELKAILDRLTALENKSLAYRDEPGYQNYRTQTPAAPLPESQVFGGNMATSLVTGTGTSNWTTVDVSSLVPNNTEYAVINFIAVKTSGVPSENGSLDVRRDDQVDSAVPTIARIVASGGVDLAVSQEFRVPMLMGGVRSFQYRITGTVSSNVEWSLTLTGYHTRRRNVADANESNGSESGSSGGTVIDAVPR